MDPVQHFIYLVRFGNRSQFEARDETCRRFGIGALEFEQAMLDARNGARVLLADTDKAAEVFGI